MILSAKAQKAFDDWVSVADWHTNNHYDRDRFYRFVHAVITYSRKSPISSEDLQLLIKNKFEGRYDEAFINKWAAFYGDLYTELRLFTELKSKKNHHF